MLLLLLSLLFAAPNTSIHTSITQIPNAILNHDYEIQRSLVAKEHLPELVEAVLKYEENVQSLTLTYDSESLELKEEIKALAEEKNILLRKVDENKLNAAVGSFDEISLSERNGMRMLLVVRGVGIGAGLIVTSGSSLGVAAFAGLLNLALMEALYIPNKNGRMKGVDFVNLMMEKAAHGAEKINPNLSQAQKSAIETSVNVLANYTILVSTLVPFMAFTGSDFSTLLDAFMKVETYTRAVVLAVPMTILTSSWKMAVSRWQEIKYEKGIDVPSKKNQSRITNGTDFINSFVLPGFWAGDILSTSVVIANGVAGYVALTYYDFRDKFRNVCRKLF